MQVTGADIRELKELLLSLDQKLDHFMVQTDERLLLMEQRLEQIEKRADTQDARILTLIVIGVAGLVLLAKLSFLPNLSF